MQKFPKLAAQKYPNGQTQLYVALPHPETNKRKKYYLGPDNSTTRTLYKSLQSLYDDEDSGLSKVQIAQLLEAGAHKKGKRALQKAADTLSDGAPLPPTPPPTDNHPNGVLLADLWKRFMKAKMGVWRKRPGGYGETKDRYKRLIFIHLLKYQGWRVKEITKSMYLEWRRSLVARGIGRTTVNTYTQCFLAVIRFGVENDLVPAETLISLQTVKPLLPGDTEAAEPKERRSVPRSDVEATLAELRDRPKLAVQLLLLTGARPMEILSLRFDAIDKTDPDVWLYRPVYHKLSRYGVERTIPLNKTAQRLIEDYVTKKKITGPYLFPAARYTGEKETRTPHYQSTSLDGAVKAAAKRAGVKPWSPYQLRHLVATELCAKGKSQLAQYLLGHKNLKTTEDYYLDRAVKVDMAKQAARGLSLGDK